MSAPVGTWDVVTAVGTAVGGVGAAVGAIAAWRAAQASRATSEDAREALAVGIRPRPGYSFPIKSDSTGDRLYAVVDNDSEWPATDVTFEMRYRDGRMVHANHERLTPSHRGGEPWQIVLEDPDLKTGKPLEERADYAVLRYSDDRGIARYEDRTTFVFREWDEGRIHHEWSNMEFDERRIR